LHTSSDQIPAERSTFASRLVDTLTQNNIIKFRGQPFPGADATKILAAELVTSPEVLADIQRSTIFAGLLIV
jgi:hypothetical protein